MIRNLFGGATKCRTIDKIDIFGDGSCKALYRLDGNANDESGNYHGTETAVTYGGGVYERGAVFNTTNSRIVASVPAIKTVCFWFKKASVTNDFLIDFRANGNTAYINMVQSGTVFSIPSGAFVSIKMNGNTIVTSSSATPYLNIDVFVVIELISTATGFILGNDTTFANGLDGSLDQVRVFNRALTAQEVATLYVECAPTSIVDNINPFEDGSLKALYKFDGDALDATGVYSGTATNVTYASGKFGNCAVFNGSSSVIKSVFPTNVKSVSFWFKTSQTTGVGVMLGAQAGDYIGVYTNQLRVSTQSFGANSSIIINNNTWTHCYVQLNATNTVAYINGVLACTLGYAFTSWNGIINVLGDVSYLGSIDQLRIFNKALTPLEVASLYNETTPMEEPMSIQVDPFKDGSGKALYRLEGNALDESGNYNGTPTSVTYGSGRFGRCAVFNGTSSKIVNTTKIFNNLSSDNYSVSAWVKLNSIAGNHNIIIGIGSANITYSSLSINNGITYLSNSAGVGTTVSASSTTSLTIGIWYHIVGTYSTSLGGKVYVNAVHEGSCAYLALSRSLYDWAETIGANSSQNISFLNGYIDQVRVFNRALTQEEVTKLYLGETDVL